jgi:hypothetical protein
MRPLPFLTPGHSLTTLDPLRAQQCVTVMSLGAGSLAFVNVVKSLEPLFNVIFGAIFMGDVLPWQVGGGRWVMVCHGCGMMWCL